MKKHITLKSIISIIAGSIFSFILVCLILFTTNYSKAASSNIEYNASLGIEYYVSGQYVEYDESTHRYSVTKDSQITIGIINNNMICEAVNGVIMSVTDGTNTYTSGTQILTFNATTNKKYSVNANTRAISKVDHGMSLSDPFVIKSFKEFNILYKVLDNQTLTTEEDDIYKETFSDVTLARLRVSYFKLFDNIIVDMNEFYGLKDFQGVFDFNGYNLTLNIINKDYTMATHGVDNRIYAGLFSTLSNSTSAPCVVRNGQLRGSISLTSTVADTSGKIFVGGIAGQSTGTVFTSNIKSSISISVDDNTSIYVGGFFGATSSAMDKHNNVSYNGVHSILSATSNGANAVTYVGGYAGTIDNTYVTGYTDESNYLTIISNSLNEISGGAVAGGFVGAIDHQSGTYEEISIDNIIFKSKGVLSVTASVNNESPTLSNKSCYAVAGGAFGVSYGTKRINHGLIRFIDGNSKGNKLSVEIFSTNQATTSQGNVFAGGLYGHVSGENYYKYIPSEAITIFDADVSIKAEQNGYDLAKAGGMFGHGAFIKNSDEKLTIILTSPEGSIDIKAEQTSISKREDTTTTKEVSAGYYSSSLPQNYSITNVDFVINNGKLLAQRNVGSTIFGPVYAGGFAGSANSNSAYNGSNFTNINISLNDSTVAGFCLSFESNLNDSKSDYLYKDYDSNVAVGGFIGFIKNYGRTDYSGFGNNLSLSNTTPGINNVSVLVDLSYTHEYVVKAIQNAVSANSDHCSEGYAGGITGLVDNAFFKDISFVGDSLYDTVINLSCTNSPNTAACGGLIAENIRENGFSVDGGLVENAKVVLDAYYSGTTNSDDTYDAYCGGAFGVIASSSLSEKRVFQNISVINTDVSCIGENTMLSISGGIVGGIWWQGYATLKNCKVIDSSVYASSMGYNFYSGGIVGMAQAGLLFDNIYIVDTSVDGYSGTRNGSVAGVCAYAKKSLDVENCYSNATLSGSTNGTLKIFPINDTASSGSLSNNYFDPFKIQNVTTSLTPNQIPNIGDTVSFNHHVAIGPSNNNSNLQNSLSITGNKMVTVFPNAVNDAKFSVEFVGDLSCLSSYNGFEITTKNNQSGTVYANLYLTIDGEKRLFTSAPIYISNGNEDTSFMVNDVTNTTPSVINSSYNGHYYVKVEVGANVNQKIKIDFNSTSPVIVLYNPSYSTQTTQKNIINDLINKSSSDVTINKFNNKIKVELTDKYILLSADNDLLSRVVIGIRIGNKYVFIDYIPNYVDYISIEPSSSTPSIGTNDSGYHIFAPGDSIIMDGYEHDAHGNKKISNVINFTADYSGGTYPVTVYSNGRIDISSSISNGYTFTITGKYNGSLSNGNVTDVTYKIVVYNDVSVSTNIVGGTFTAQRKAISNQPYTFAVNPNPGFGLSPDLVSITIGSNEYILESDALNGTDITHISSKIGARPLVSYDNVIVTVNGVDFVVSYSSISGGYTITIPAAAVTDDISIEFEYSLTADIIFDFGQAYASKGYNRYYLYTVKTGTILNEELYEEFKSYVDISLFGYKHNGYYLTDNATSIESYGEEFKEILTENKVINGPIYFYARWTYEVIIEYPDGVTIESTLPIGLLENTSGGEIKLVPINVNSSFTFKVIPGSTYQGLPKFFVYIYNEDGTFTDVTSHCSKNEFGGYELDNEVVDGIIFVKVLNENFVFNDGESENHESVDVTIYGDSIFTLNYNINYSKEGVSINNAVLGNTIQLQFEKALPSNTSIRLYRTYNSKAQYVYQYVLSSESMTINLADFVNMKDGKTLANTSINEPLIYNETYYLTVTLPNNQLVTSFIDNNSVMFMCTNYDVSNINIDEYLSDNHKGNITNRPNLYESGLSKVEFNILQTCLVTVTENASKLTVSFGSKQVVDGKIVDDLRHKDKYYVWEVFDPDGINVTNTNTVFGTSNFITNTLSASYYLANGTTNNINSLSGCVIRLLEVTNTLSPASGVVLYEKQL